MSGHDELRHLLGAYVLGGLSPEDRARLEEHLPSCEECREELAGFAPVPALLRGGPAEPRPIDGAASDGPAPDREPASPDLLPRLLAEVRRRRRARRRLLALVAAAALVAFAVVGGWLALSGEDPAPAPTVDGATLVAFEPLGDWECRAEAELVERQWGTELTLTASGLPGHGPYWIEVTAADGTSQRAATWGATPAGRASVSGATSIAREEIVAVRVVSEYGALMDARLPG